MQAETAARLAAGHGNLTLVGDDSQSIYGFRGARYRNILEFAEQFFGCRIIKLEHNYRSAQSVLDLTDATSCRLLPSCISFSIRARNKGSIPSL